MLLVWELVPPANVDAIPYANAFVPGLVGTADCCDYWSFSSCAVMGPADEIPPKVLKRLARTDGNQRRHSEGIEKERKSQIAEDSAGAWRCVHTTGTASYFRDPLPLGLFSATPRCTRTRAPLPSSAGIRARHSITVTSAVSLSPEPHSIFDRSARAIGQPRVGRRCAGGFRARACRRCRKAGNIFSSAGQCRQVPV